jgi:hypothetical protein
MSSCATANWSARTSSHSAQRRLVVFDHWAGQGIGQQVMGSAVWLAIARRTDRALRFAVCIPASEHFRFASDLKRRGMHDVPPMPVCEHGRVFDLHAHFSFAGLGSLQASTTDAQRAALIDLAQPATSAGPPAQCKHGGCASAVLARLRAALFSTQSTLASAPVLGVHLLHVRIATRLLRTLAAPDDEPEACLRRLRPLRAWRVPPCDVGLHVRTLALDDVACNTLEAADEGACPSHLLARLQRSTAALRTCGSSWHMGVDGCPGKQRFVTSDLATVYATTVRLVPRTRTVRPLSCRFH